MEKDCREDGLYSYLEKEWKCTDNQTGQSLLTYGGERVSMVSIFNNFLGVSVSGGP